LVGETLLLLISDLIAGLQGKQAQEIMREGKMVPGSMIIGEHYDAAAAASQLQYCWLQSH
jgi:hypothetical protein